MKYAIVFFVSMMFFSTSYSQPGNPMNQIGIDHNKLVTASQSSKWGNMNDLSKLVLTKSQDLGIGQIDQTFLLGRLNAFDQCDFAIDCLLAALPGNSPATQIIRDATSDLLQLSNKKAVKDAVAKKCSDLIGDNSLSQKDKDAVFVFLATVYHSVDLWSVSGQKAVLPRWLRIALCDAICAATGYIGFGPIGAVVVGAACSIGAAAGGRD